MRYYLIEMYEDGRMKGKSQGYFLNRKKGNLSTVLKRPFLDKKKIMYRPIVQYVGDNEDSIIINFQEKGFKHVRGVVSNSQIKKYYILSDFRTLKDFIREFYFA